MRQQLRIGQHAFHALIERFVVVFCDKTVFAVAQKLPHAGNVSGNNRLSQNQALRNKGAEALVNGGANQKIRALHQVIGVLMKAQQLCRSFQMVVPDVFLQHRALFSLTNDPQIMRYPFLQQPFMGHQRTGKMFRCG